MIVTGVCHKVGYDRPEAARHHVTLLARLHGIEPDVYDCEDCDYFHVGYPPRRREHLIRTSYQRLKKRRGRRKWR